MACTAPSGYTAFHNGRWYKYHNTNKATITQARQACAYEGAQLAIIYDRTDYNNFFNVGTRKISKYLYSGPLNLPFFLRPH